MTDLYSPNDEYDDGDARSGVEKHLLDFAYEASHDLHDGISAPHETDGIEAATLRSNGEEIRSANGSHGDAGGDSSELPEFAPSPVPDGVYGRLQQVAEERGGESVPPAEYDGSVARSMFDTPQSKDDSLTLVMPKDGIDRLPTQSLVRIKSRDGRDYLGAVVAGPFAEPDGLRADSPVVVSVTVSDSLFMPPYHGRVQVEILGEDTEFGLVPPRFRPLPNSPCVPLTTAETAKVLNVAPPPEDLPVPVGLAVGHDKLTVALPGRKMGVLPRHMGVLGTTGGGKSTTVSGLIDNLQRAGYAVILIDTEGEYTHIDEPTDRPAMLALLERRGLKPHGVANTSVYRLVGRGTTNPGHPDQRQFSLPFANLSPFMVSEILELNEAQDQRYQFAYTQVKRALAELKVYPGNDEEKAEAMEIDELERGYPKMRLSHMIDMVQACLDIVSKVDSGGTGEQRRFTSSEFRDGAAKIKEILSRYGNDMPKVPSSWMAIIGRLRRLARLGIFDAAASPGRFGGGVAPLDFNALTQPGRVSIFDLSGTDSPQINNLVIAELLRGIHEQQDESFKAYETARERGEPGAEPRRTMIVIEEAHEFLSRERVKQMPVLFDQVARVARRGRKRWLGLTFVTQLPQHLPDEVLGLLNNFILHKISDDGVVSRLKRVIGGIDDSLWHRLPGLAPGQAILAAASLARPLLVSVNPTPCKLRMTE